MMEWRATAAHLQRVVMRRSNCKGNAEAHPTRINIKFSTNQVSPAATQLPFIQVSKATPSLRCHIIQL